MTSIHFSPSNLKFHFPNKIPNRGFDRSLSTEKKYFKTAFKTTDTINADPSNSMNVDYGWYASTVSHRTRQMLHTAVTEITRLISPRGSSTRNPSINVVTCESYYRPPFHQLGHPSFLYPSNRRQLVHLPSKYSGVDRGSSNLAERSRPRRRV